MENSSNRRITLRKMRRYRCSITPLRRNNSLLCLRNSRHLPRCSQQIPMGLFQLPTLGQRKEISVPSVAQRSYHLARYARLLGNLADCTRSNAFARFEMPLRQIPPLVALNHQAVALRIHHYPAGCLNDRKLLGKTRKGGIGIGGTIVECVVRFQKKEYLRSLKYRRVIDGQRKCALAHLFSAENKRLILKIDNSFHNYQFDYKFTNK